MIATWEVGVEDDYQGETVVRGTRSWPAWPSSRRSPAPITRTWRHTLTTLFQIIYIEISQNRNGKCDLKC